MRRSAFYTWVLTRLTASSQRPVLVSAGTGSLIPSTAVGLLLFASEEVVLAAEAAAVAVLWSHLGRGKVVFSA